MLERTVRRAGLLIPMERLVVIGTAHHGPYMFQSLGNRPPGSVLLQPANKDTAPGILFPLVHILKKDPRALVALFPSDHFVLPGRRLMGAVEQAAEHLRHTHSDSLIILAAEATYPETEYGWIAPGVPVASEKPGSVFCVNRFVEKPTSRDADRMLEDGWLWNTMVLVARATSLLELFREAVPDLVRCFTILQRFLGSNREHVITNEVYSAIPSLNFSATVLAPRPERLLVIPTRHMRWSDWGRKERIAQTISSLNYAARAAIKIPPTDLVLPA